MGANISWINESTMATVMQLPQKSINFDYKISFPLSFYKTKGNSRIIQIMVGIESPFDGTGWSLSIGDKDNNQSLYNLTILDQAQTYQIYPGYYYAVSTDINIYLNIGTATMGSGFAYILEA